MTTIDIDHLRGWLGKQTVIEQTIEPFAARALAGLLDNGHTPGVGDELPLPWHWLYFLDPTSAADTGVDGHPKRGGFLPPVPLPRRMWAAGSLQMHTPLHIGSPARKVSTVRSVELKEGRTGPLVFVKVEHELRQGERLCVGEEQSLVYRQAPLASTPLPPGDLANEPAQWCRTVVPDAVMLFRFSALTYNAHRIHYDRDYAVQQEFYPALVVHGPLLATMLLDLLRRELPGIQITEYSFRAVRPAFDTSAIRLCGRLDGDTARLWSLDERGIVGMSASARIASTS